jgi:hypothetical protein
VSDPYVAIPLWPLALTAALLPLLGMHGSYLIAASEGHVPWCLPYWDGCTSISATGRQLPEKVFFKLLMMPAAVTAAVYWVAMAAWLRAMGVDRSRCVLVLSSGLIGSAFWLLYGAALGEVGDLWQAVRRAGIVVFFGLTFVAQLASCGSLHGHLRFRTEDPGRSWVHAQLRLCQLMLAIGLLSVLLDATWRAYDTVEDAFEWVLALLLEVHVALTAGLWRAAGAAAGFGDRAS